VRFRENTGGAGGRGGCTSLSAVPRFGTILVRLLNKRILKGHFCSDPLFGLHTEDAPDKLEGLFPLIWDTGSRTWHGFLAQISVPQSTIFCLAQQLLLVQVNRMEISIFEIATHDL
jgi:hypothetical protein